jgi:hypothetical protein
MSNEVLDQESVKFGEEMAVETPEGTAFSLGVVAGDSVVLHQSAEGEFSAKWGKRGVFVPTPRAGKTLGEVVYDFVLFCYDNGKDTDDEQALASFETNFEAS